MLQVVLSAFVECIVTIRSNPKQLSCKEVCGHKKAIVKKDVKSKVAAKKWL